MTGIPPEQWIHRIQRAQSISRSDPNWADAQADIHDMQARLHQELGTSEAPGPARQLTDITNRQEMQEAQSMSPTATLLEGVAKGMSWPLGEAAAKLTGSGPILEASAAQHQLENIAGEIGGGLLTAVGPGMAVKVARAGRIARLTEEGLQMDNARKALRLAKLREAMTAAPEATTTTGEAAQAGAAGANPAGSAVPRAGEAINPIAGTEGRGFAVTGTRATPPIPTDMPTLADMTGMSNLQSTVGKNATQRLLEQLAQGMTKSQ